MCIHLLAEGGEAAPVGGSRAHLLPRQWQLQEEEEEGEEEEKEDKGLSFSLGSYRMYTKYERKQHINIPSINFSYL